VSAKSVVRIVAGALVALVVIAGAVAVLSPGKKAPPVDEWQAFTDPTGAFTARFPGTPHHSSEQQSTGLGDVRVVLWTSSYSDLGVAVGYADYPVALAGMAVRLGLEGAADGAAKAVNGHLVGGVSFVEVDGRPAADFTVSKGSQLVRARAILDGARIYVLETTAKGSLLAAHQTLLDSFQINT
jgi:hypothetical protein